MRLPAVLLCILVTHAQPSAAGTHVTPKTAGRAAADTDAARARKLEALFSRLTRNAANPRGCSVGVRLNGKEAYRGGFGNGGVGAAPVDADTRFYLASTSKPILGLAVLKLHEDTPGGILDKTLAQLMPGLRDRRFSRVTVRDVLRHRAGLTRDTEDVEPYVRPYPGRAGRRVLTLGGEYWENATPPERDLLASPTDGALPAILARLDDRRRVGALFTHPIGKYEYSNLGYELLGGLIQKLTGKTPTRYLDEKIFRPAGMGRTMLADPRDSVGGRDFARGVNSFGRNDPFNQWAGLLGSGGVISSAGDMLKLAALLDDIDDGKRPGVLRRDTLRSAFEGIKDANDTGYVGYGLGWSTSTPDQSRKVGGYQWHGGWAYHYGTFFGRLDRAGCRLSIAVLCNHDFPRGMSQLSTDIEKIYCP